MEALLNEWLWQERYWLPPGIGWKDTEMKEDEGHFPLPRDLFCTFPLALIFIVLRFVFERIIAIPLSRCLGVKDRIRIQVSPVPQLEAFYKYKSRRPSESEVVDLVKQCDLTERKIQTWFKNRRNQDRPSKTKKFCEESWKFVFYLISFTAGLSSLINTSWFWDQKECWRGYPKQPVSDTHYWYYMLEMGFYLSLILTFYWDVKRKDSKFQLMHHIATVFLIAFSYCANYVRVGLLVMLLHDSSDYILELAKMLHYAVWKRTSELLFIVFAVVFLVTRIMVLPWRLIHTTMFVSMEFYQPFFGYYFFNALLGVLQLLHVYWGRDIVQMAFKFLFTGKIKDDERSDTESEDDEEGEGEEAEDEESRMNSKPSPLANDSVLNNLTNQRSVNNRLPKAR